MKDKHEGCFDMQNGGHKKSPGEPGLYFFKAVLIF